MQVFPAAFPLAGLTVAVAGAGEAAEAKARLFAGSPVRLVRVDPQAAASVAAYTGARLAFVALPGEAAASAAKAARTAGALVNAVDRPELCDFHTPALVDRGAVVAAVATGGGAPVLAAELRAGIEALWPERLGALAELIAELAGEVRAALPDAAARRAWLRRELVDGPAAAFALAGDMDAARAEARARLKATPTPAAGRLLWLEPPASVDLLSLRALRALSRADLILAAPGVDPPVLGLARRDAPRLALTQTDPAAVQAGLERGETVVCIGPRAAFEPYGLPVALPCAAEA